MRVLYQTLLGSVTRLRLQSDQQDRHPKAVTSHLQDTVGSNWGFTNRRTSHQSDRREFEVHVYSRKNIILTATEVELSEFRKSLFNLFKGDINKINDQEV